MGGFADIERLKVIMNKKKLFIIISIFIILMGLVVVCVLSINKYADFLPKKYQQFKIGDATIYLDNGKLISSEINAKFEGQGIKLIFKNKKLTVMDSIGGPVTDINGITLKALLETIINDFYDAAGYEAYKVDIISDPRFLDSLKNGTEVLLYSYNNKTLEPGIYDGINGLGAATVIDKEISETRTIIILE